MLGRERSIGRVPKLIYDMYIGDYSQVSKLVHSLKSSGQSISAMLIMMDGASGGSDARMNQIQLEDRSTALGPVTHFLFPELSDAWDVPDLGIEYRSPIISDKPVMILSGTMDARTPISNGDEIAKHLVNSVHFIVENVGHPPSLLQFKEELTSFLSGEPVTSNRVSAPMIEFDRTP
jgi:pimeloyl-ACP methyl ester carboxylesterase